jgi:protein-S-isoprenylcysteine O-methyltransferase Ste14
MKTTPLEFRLRAWIYLVVYCLGFYAPWDRLLHLDRNRTAWLWLASQLTSHRWLSFTAATQLVLIAGILCALVAAGLRTWASAYMDISVVKDRAMHGDHVVAAGPYRYLRNPLYLGAFIHTLALTLLMPLSGAVFVIIIIVLFALRLIAIEEAFLNEKLGEPYLAYRAKVPSLLPALTPRVPASPIQPKWTSALLGELYYWGVAISFLALGWRYNSLLIIQGVIVSLGVSFIVRAFIPSPTSNQTRLKPDRL